MNVEELLVSKEISFMPKGGDFLVRCLNPEHNDRNPSMRVDQITGIFNCFSCAYKGNLFTHFGEKPNQLQLRREFLKKKIKEKGRKVLDWLFPKVPCLMLVIGETLNHRPTKDLKPSFIVETIMYLA